jgi:hypothetical protein
MSVMCGADVRMDPERFKCTPVDEGRACKQHTNGRTIAHSLETVMGVLAHGARACHPRRDTVKASTARMDSLHRETYDEVVLQD